MDQSRCPTCRKRLITMNDRTGRTSLVCLECDNIDPMKTDAAKWANSSLASSSVAWHPNCPGAGLLGAGIFRIYEEREETFEGRILN
jgi:hypothetical protein